MNRAGWLILATLVAGGTLDGWGGPVICDDRGCGFDVPNLPEDYIHRVGRTARAELTGDAITLVAPDEEQDLRMIERAIGRGFERAKLAGFDYTKRPAERLEIPIGERIAAIRSRKADERARARANAARRGGYGSATTPARRSSSMRAGV